MRTLRRLLRRLSNFATLRRDDQRLKDEIEGHVALQTAENLRGGLSPYEARRQALLKFGPVESIKEDYRAERGMVFIETFLQDLRFAFRMLRKSPGFALAVILTLALGVGANVTMISVVDMLLFRVPAHLFNPEEIMRVDAVDKTGGPQMDLANYHGYRQLSDSSHLLELAAQSSPWATDYGRGSGAREIQRNFVTHTYFDVLGTQLLIGRPFTAEEETRPGGATVAILGYGFWKKALGGDPKILGRDVLIDGRAQTVIGIAPRGFTGLDPSSVDVWMPISDGDEGGGRNPITDSGTWWLQVIGRPVRGANRELASVEATSAFRHSGGNPDETIRLEPYLATRKTEPSKEARVSLWLMGVALLVFLIACANVTNLFLVRVIQRRQELAVRIQLGATRSRLIRQMLVESSVVSLIGGTAALLLAYWARPLAQAYLLPPNFYEGDFLNWGMLGIAVCLAVLAGVISGVWPAWKASRSDALLSLNSGGPVLHERSSARSVLLAVQVALTVVLSVGAALFVRSLRSVHAIQLGFDAPHVLVATMASSGYKPAEISAGYERMRERALTLPGVERAALVAYVPFAGYSLISFRVSATDSSPAREVSAGFNAVSPDYFASMGLRIIQGRSFLPSDRIAAPLTPNVKQGLTTKVSSQANLNSAPIPASDQAAASLVAIVNESLAREIAPDGNVLGRILTPYDKKHFLQIVGVVPDERRYWLFDDWPPGQPKGSLYMPLDQPVNGLTDLSPNPTGLVIRTAGKPSAFQRNVASALKVVAPGSRFVDVRPITELIDKQTLPWRMGASVFLIFGVLALALAAVGTFGMLSFLVKSRTAEIGVRMALGAMPGNIVRLVLARGLLFVGIGVAIGIGAAFGLARLMRSLLYGVAPTDPVSYLLAAGVVLIVALAACYFPARRATRVDPMVALRYE